MDSQCCRASDGSLNALQGFNDGDKHPVLRNTAARRGSACAPLSGRVMTRAHRRDGSERRVARHRRCVTPASSTGENNRGHKTMTARYSIVAVRSLSRSWLGIRWSAIVEGKEMRKFLVRARWRRQSRLAQYLTSPLVPSRHPSATRPGVINIRVVEAPHVIAVISWMAGMLYLPRLFVYHCEAEPGSTQSETFKAMERRLLNGIIVPAMAVTWLAGLYLVWAAQCIRRPGFTRSLPSCWRCPC
jgi:hypothetical protein